MKPIYLAKSFESGAAEYALDRQIGANCTDPHYHSGTELIYMECGEALVFFSEAWHPLYAGDLAVLPPGSVHCVRCEDTHAVKWVVGIRDRAVFAEGKLAFPTTVEALWLRGIGTGEFPSLLADLDRADALSDRPSGRWQARATLYRIFGFLFDSWGCDLAPASQDPVLVSLEAYLHGHFGEELSPYETAERLHIAYSTLAKKMEENYHCTFVEYLRHIRIEEAKRRLASGRENVTEIACAVGFSDSSYFIRSFVKETGMTPLRYRKKILGRE